MHKVIALFWAILLGIVTTSVDAQRFMTLPFDLEEIVITSGWYYDNGNLHRGIDYALPPAEPFEVRAVATGRAVLVYDEMSGYGNFAFQVHDQTSLCGQRFSLYAHLESAVEVLPVKNVDQIRKDITNNDFSDWADISTGEVVGIAGNTGWPGIRTHLHYESNCGGYALNKTDPYDIYDYSWKYPEPCGANYLWSECPPKLSTGEPVIPDTLYAVDRDMRLLILDENGDRAILVGQINFEEVYGLAYDRVSDKLYTVKWIPNNTAGELVELNKLTAQGSVVGPINVPDVIGVRALTFGPGNVLYGIGNTRYSTSQLVTIDPSTGQGSVIGGTGAQLDGLTYDYDSGRMYAIKRFGFGAFYEVNPVTGGFSLIQGGNLSGVIKLADKPGTEVLYACKSYSGNDRTNLGTLDPTAPRLEFMSFFTINWKQSGIRGLEMVKLHVP